MIKGLLNKDIKKCQSGSSVLSWCRGFSLLEVLVGMAIFLIVATTAYEVFSSIFRLSGSNQARLMAVTLANEQFEIIRNMPYMSVGLTNGIPLGILPQTQQVNRGGINFTVDLTIRNINFSTSTIQASDKLVEISINCESCSNFQPVKLTGQISPANLQSASNGGAIVTQVFDANGQPVNQATVVIQSVATSSVTNTDVTNNFGILNVIGVPEGTNMYRVTATKQGYSTDRTYPVGGSGNPNPIKPDATVLIHEATQLSLFIDRLSSLNFSSVSPICSSIGSINFDLKGAKEIGPGVSKYSQSLVTNSSGELSLGSMEWDTYTLTPTDGDYDVAGINPNSPITLSPGNNQNVQLVVVPRNPKSLMVTVVDSATHLPLSQAEVTLEKTGYNQTKTTGQGYIRQTDWSGGSGQEMYSDTNKFFTDNGLIDYLTSAGNIILDEAFGQYNISSPGILESSTFDTGTSSNFYTFSWDPISQSPLNGSESVKFQFAASDEEKPASWNFLGPDGTNGSYFTIPGTSINANQNGKRYVRYKAYLSTITATSTPTVSDVIFAYTTQCTPPGQVLFQGLSSDTYDLTVSKDGYVTWTGTVTIGSNWQEKIVELEI